jgi:hypothetical protein
MRQFLYAMLLLAPLAANANECFDTATRMLEVLKPAAERVGEVSLERVTLSKGIYNAIVGQNNDVYAEYSRGSIYLYVQFCQQAEDMRFQILAHELGHAIDDAKGVLESMSWSMTGGVVPWGQRRSEMSANQWMGKIVNEILKQRRH